MKHPRSQLPESESTPEAPTEIHAWLLKEQQRLAEKVGEPIFVTIRLVYDGFCEVDIETINGRFGQAGGDLLPETMNDAVETLLYLDKITGFVPDA
jgi:hypothetical protein